MTDGLTELHTTPEFLWIIDSFTAVVIVLTAIAGQFFMLLIVSYLKKRGEMVATRETIRAITLEIEDAKKEFNERLEKMKASLQHLSSHALDMATEKRNAILNYNDAYNKWYHAITTTPPFDKQTSRRDELLSDLWHLEIECTIASSRLELYIEDDKLTRLKESIHEKTLILHRVSSSNIIQGSRLWIRAQQLRTSDDSDDQEYEKVIAQLQQRLNDWRLQQESIGKGGLWRDIDAMRSRLSTHLKEALKEF